MKRFGTTSILAVLLACVAVPAAAFTFLYAMKSSPVLTISVDQFTNGSSQHATEVEPSIFSNGNTIVALTQQGRFTDGGSSDVGFSTSTDGGNHWKFGSLPGITNVQKPGNPWDRDTDPAITYDVKHGVWLASTLPLIGATGQMPLVSASKDGLHWANPVEVAANDGDFQDKNWIACDNGASSPHKGNCYVEWDDNSQGDVVYMSTSSDGGKTWSSPYNTNGGGLGGQPVTLPNGHVVVPFLGNDGNIDSLMSTDGGKTWGNLLVAAPISWNPPAGGLRNLPLPSARADDGGTVYVVWNDCSFRGCAGGNDIVMTTTTDGMTWTPVARIPIDALNSPDDHMIPGIAVQPGTKGNKAHLGVAYYFYPNANCSSGSCALTLGYISSTDGGATWGAPVQLGSPALTTWLANTDQGYMAGDYIAATFTSTGDVHVAAAQAKAPGAKYDEFLVSNKKKLSEDSNFRVSSRGERPVPGVHGHRIPKYPPLD